GDDLVVGLAFRLLENLLDAVLALAGGSGDNVLFHGRRRRRHVHGLFGGGDQRFLLGSIGRPFASNRLVDVVVLVGHRRAARIFRLHLDRTVLGPDQRRRIAIGTAAEGEGEGADGTEQRDAADQGADQHGARFR